ncbi:uncharacterized protein NMK_2400 [Novimethylophilus kurashikiensis]|uniref:ADP-ribosylglycohydrolase n=1 Tax=Novimethylophilus kurashikiensis TaxID=1825523 RepID=A0A2R5FAF0_9PROT|nr:ADP-ribosylglycohydrolase family protein [Novimethylophilus kurashikiensis]GBG14799.1 uncharacterized protein NMK_2400 [Novimethylophilus kurashikiensis]
MSSAITEPLRLALGYHPGDKPVSKGAVLAGVFGALMGDAFGVPHEFKPPYILPTADHLNLVMPAHYPKTYSGIPYGTWSDDGSQLLCLLDSLESEGGQLVLSTFGARLLAWYERSLHQAGGIVFDCGGQTAYALGRLKEGVTPCRAALSRFTAEAERSSNGNGALMRALPAAFSSVLWEVSEEEAVRMGAQQSRITHAHPISMITCALYTQLAIQVMHGSRLPSWKDRAISAAHQLESELELSDEELKALDEIRRFGRSEMPTGGGYVVNSFWSAIYALDRSTDYLSAIRAAVSLGDDTDTTACIVGGLAALEHGLATVPTQWWEVLTLPEESVGLLTRIAA